ncbi:MAG: putative Ig domain-containing protein [Magnetococcales bacterium]|nr:putative Ig domain-containing protein [Magnetococcales bacterium]
MPGKPTTLGLSILFLLACSNAQAAAPRVINPISDQTWSGSGSKSFQVPANTFRDGDGDPLTYSARREDGSALPSWLRFNRTTRTFSGNPPAGIQKVSLKVIASDGHEATASSAFTLNLMEANDTPRVRKPIGGQIWSGSGGKSFLVPADTFADGDGDSLTYSATMEDGSALPSWLRFSTSSRTFFGNPPADAVAMGLKVTATDGQGASVSHVFGLSFRDDTNDRPTVRIPLVDQRWRGGGVHAFQIPENIFMDRDGDSLTYRARMADGSTMPSWLVFNPATRTLSGNPPSGATSKSIRIVASDGNGGTALSTFVLSFEGTNDAPSIVTTIPDQVWSGSGIKSFQLPSDSFSDGDGDALRYTVTLNDGAALPPWLRFNASTRTLTGNPPAGTSTLGLLVRVSDNRGGVVQVPFTLTFNNANDAPTVVTPISTQSWTGSGTKSLQIPATTFSDADGDALTYTAAQADGSALPSWLTFSSSTRTFSGNPPAGINGLALKVTAHDGHEGIVHAPFTLTFSNVNDAPTVVTPISAQFWTGSGAKSLQIPATTFSDADGDALTYTAAQADGSSLPSWLTFSTSTRTFSGNPPAEIAALSIRVTANDGHEGIVHAPFTLTLSNINDAPTVVTPISAQSWTGSGAKSLQIPAMTFSDADGDALTYTATQADGSALPSWLTFSSSTRTFSGNPPAGLMSINLKVTASDRSGDASHATFTLSFSGVNDPPVAVSGTLTTFRNMAVTDVLTGMDTEGDRLTYSIVSNGTKGSAILNATTGSVTYTPTSGLSGTDSFTFKVNDGTVDSAPATVAVTIEVPPNVPPVAVNGSLNANQGVATTGTLNASDEEGSALTYQIIDNGSKGTATITNQATGAFSYTPNSGSTGTDTFTFRVNDGADDSSVATVNITINDLEITNSLGMTFRLINAGNFTMGAAPSEISTSTSEWWWYLNSIPNHMVTISRSFYMQSTEVTQGQWQAVTGNNPSYFNDCGSNCPVEQVSWNDIQVFISLINLRGDGTYRLPTEAEWEYAVRAGAASDSFLFANEGNIGDYAWYNNNSTKTHPVAQKLPNSWGLYDMHGNVSEWVSDWDGHQGYSSDPVTDPQGSSTGTAKIHRGGGWRHPVDYLRSAHRDADSPDTRFFGFGFRLVKTIP